MGENYMNSTSLHQHLLLLVQKRFQVLMTLAQIDIDLLANCINEPDLIARLTQSYQEQGKLLFNEELLLKQDAKPIHATPEITLPPELPLPRLELQRSALEQLDNIRLVCQYLLEKKQATLTAKSANQIPPPLFTKYTAGINENKFTYGVDVKTGKRFLKGERINEASAQKILLRLKEKFPQYFVK